MADQQAMAVAAAQARAMRNIGLTPGPMDEPTWPVPTMPKPPPVLDTVSAASPTWFTGGIRL